MGCTVKSGAEECRVLGSTRPNSQKSLMSAVTDTTKHESGVGVVVLGWQTTRVWIPACAGTTVGAAAQLFSEEWQLVV